jgi:hypothetical protein
MQDFLFYTEGPKAGNRSSEAFTLWACRVSWRIVCLMNPTGRRPTRSSSRHTPLRLIVAMVCGSGTSVRTLCSSPTHVADSEAVSCLLYRGNKAPAAPRLPGSGARQYSCSARHLQTVTSPQKPAYARPSAIRCEWPGSPDESHLRAWERGQQADAARVASRSAASAAPARPEPELALPCGSARFCQASPAPA